MNFRWKKLGVLIEPDISVPWMATHAGPSHVRVDNDQVLVYVSGRDINNVSRVGIVAVRLSGEEHSVLSVSLEPCLEVGAVGLFDENGASYPWIIQHDELFYMYYVGWVNGGRSRFQNFTGVAISEDGFRFERVKNTPILDRTDLEPFGSGSCCVWVENGLFKMYYTAFEPWIQKPGKNEPRYNLKLATSANGIDWARDQTVVIDFKSHLEHAISRPSLLMEDGLYRLWYCSRGDQYRIGYAQSTDGKNYIRHDESVGIELSDDGWDSEMQEYPHIFDYDDRRYMVYNGNNFGQTGLGLAVLEQHD